MTELYTYTVVVPVFNEEEVLEPLYGRLVSVMDSLGAPYEIVLVNDGSTDRSLEIMEDLHAKDPRVKVIDLSRNFGHQMAITAGMDHASGQAVVVMDADLQDPPEAIPSLVEKWKAGSDVVYGIRQQRAGEGFLKRATASLFYRVLKSAADIPIPVDAGDFRLLDREVVDTLKQIREKNRYLRGLTSWVGFNQTGVPYERQKRFAGQTKYPFSSMLRLAVDATFSFTNLPLRMAVYLGFLIAAASFAYLAYVILLKLLTGVTIQGWASLMVVILFLGGVQLMFLGVVGEYVGRIAEETKRRPLYIVKQVMDQPQRRDERAETPR